MIGGYWRGKPVRWRLAQQISVGHEGGCWLWTGNKSVGYGLVRYGKTRTASLAHRLMYELEKGPIPEGYHVDHLCRHRGCVNPDHLEAVTPGENVRRWAQTIEHCPKGHEYAPANTLIRSTRPGMYQRRCLICKRTTNREYMQRRRTL